MVEWDPIALSRGVQQSGVGVAFTHFCPCLQKKPPTLIDILSLCRKQQCSDLNYNRLGTLCVNHVTCVAVSILATPMTRTINLQASHTHTHTHAVQRWLSIISVNLNQSSPRSLLSQSQCHCSSPMARDVLCVSS